ncbi:AAA family ATPase [Thiohalocapsa sp. ML1]|uniref:AAA family ATPase n=1 Tax=Thiohalocapsa sp. ML1 TaxID=1431688 RepID=UPI00073211A3|nr:ATP-binding protein [Thiohalocapsa sp. ML1]
MIQTIQIEGFKSLLSQCIELGRVNCFIGANGVGKTALLEAIGILGAAADGSLGDADLKRRGVRPGVPALYKSSFKDGPACPTISLSAEDEHGVCYRVSLGSTTGNGAGDWCYDTEALTTTAGPSITRLPEHQLDSRNGFIKSQMVQLPFDSPERDLLERLQDYAIFSPSTRILRGVDPDPEQRRPVGLFGGGLADAMNGLMMELVNFDPEESTPEQRDAGEALYDSILELIDWAELVAPDTYTRHLLSPSVPRTGRVLHFTDRYMAGDRNQLTGYDASEGALYVLFAAILCLDSGAPRLLAIDNIDQALNPHLAMRLTERLVIWLKTESQDRQVLFTTHNPAVLDGLDLGDDEIRLFAVDRNSAGHSVFTRILPTPELLALNGQYPLSRLWLMGNLGAVPNV